MEKTKQPKKMSLEELDRLDEQLLKAADPNISYEQMSAIIKPLTFRKFCNSLKINGVEEANNYDADESCVYMCRFSPPSYTEHRIVLFSNKKSMKIYKYKGSSYDVNKMFSDVYHTFDTTTNISFTHFLEMMDNDELMKLYNDNENNVSDIKNIYNDIAEMLKL